MNVIYCVKRYLFDTTIFFSSTDANEAHRWCEAHNNGVQSISEQEYHVYPMINGAFGL